MRGTPEVWISTVSRSRWAAYAEHMESAQVVICGGGVAALEVLLALRALLAIRPHVVLVAPNREFVYAPMAVAEPFGLARTRLFGLAEVAADLGAELHIGVLERVLARQHRVVVGDGTRLRYDAAIVAVGARRRVWLKGAISLGDENDAGAVRELLARLEQGAVGRLAFAVAQDASWTLPVYEFALLTAARLADRAVSGVELELVTPEAGPLDVFGPAASGMVRGLLADRGIRLRTGTCAQELAAGRLRLSSGEALDVDAVLALPQLEGPRVPGLPADEDGFIPIDEHCRIVGCGEVYAIGDATDCAYKQGGIATQQADVAAACIAAGLGLPGRAPVFEPLLRGMLLTGVAPMYMRSSKAGGAGAGGEVAGNALWWPPTKIAGRHLGPYLASANVLQQHALLEDRPVATAAHNELESAHREARELALVLAEADAGGGDFGSAAAWLDVVERLDGTLPEGYLKVREDWRARP
jgi:sulfide:quinone oxidoreductase